MAHPPPLTPGALRVLATAFLVTESPKRLRRMRKAVKRSLETNGASPISSEMHADHMMVLVALERAERKALKRRSK